MVAGNGYKFTRLRNFDLWLFMLQRREREGEEDRERDRVKIKKNKERMCKFSGKKIESLMLDVL